MKCALQEFQHMHPQLTSRIRTEKTQTTSIGGMAQTVSSTQSFIPMECPTFPLDTEFACKDMLHDKLDVENGPLWRVQLVTEATMDKSNIGKKYASCKKETNLVNWPSV